jgi:hypothetical protein
MTIHLNALLLLGAVECVSSVSELVPEIIIALNGVTTL